MTDFWVGFPGRASLISVAAAGILLGACTEAWADDTYPPQENSQGFLGRVGDQAAEWNVTLGAGARLAPAYEGADETDISPVPLISAEFGDHVTLNTKGLYVDAFKTDQFKVGLHGGYETGRSEDDSDDLDGLGDVDMGGVVGLYAAYQIGPVEFNAEVDKTLGGSEGLTAEVGADITHRWERFTFSGGASATWANSDHMDAYFSISPDQARRSGLAQYDAEAGFKRVDVDASVTYMMTRHWLVRGQVGLGVLVGDAADSPIAQETVQPSTMIAIGYKF